LAVQLNRIPRGARSPILKMIAGHFDHICTNIFKQSDVARVAAKPDLLLVWIRGWTILCEGNFVADVRNVCIAQPIPDVPGGVKDPLLFHGPGCSPNQGGHSGHHHHS
jgi:hypothetical protein